MRKVVSNLVAAAVVLLVAGVASAQNADPNTGGPTKNTLRLRLVEPREGAQISGSSIRVAVDYNRTVFGEGQGTKFGNSNYPQPRFDVYLDNSLKETLKGGEKNVADLTNVPPGKHKIAVVAKNVSNEIIDRAEVTVTNTAGTSATEATTGTTDQTTSGSTSSYSSSSSANSNTTAASPSSSSNSTMNDTSRSTTSDNSRSSMSTSPSSDTGSTASRSTSTADNNTTSTSDRLPHTASDAPAAALLGATLLAAGLYVSRRRV